ncbi:GH25 family lysozyme [Flavilitoribacter nigricans]|uniref:Peptidoglycan binding-like domain-containing protein n=1 Tax=Flavilitoribacter nigricans (strain ATCC 23147 / DSM 23189 / NBRC 102662 / NCIMB 1420 / SS-2) TaxID=1122177 RepID=A0A2D0N1C0_FLAN2|nr:GH25 family lysozyme [Flavilitoribacter nigricans]PHN02230.1 hypothetical protein CRP01_33390 [Flavilitoribacter nigricans DSM 23189 = NBRC 102662]
MIKVNARGPEVKDWQQFLKQQKLLQGTADGIFGPATLQATKVFQENSGLNSDGIVGPQTIAKAKEAGYVPAPIPNFPPPDSINAILDLYRLNEIKDDDNNTHTVFDFVEARNSGIMAIFHKATQGVDFKKDMPKYDERKQAALEANLLWGAYHFGTDQDGKDQAKFFLDNIGQAGNVLPALDFEAIRDKNGKIITLMNIQQAEDFVTYIKDTTGKWPGIYGSSDLREAMKNYEGDILTNCWLWLAGYVNESQLKLPAGWSRWTIWQYTDGEHPNPSPAVPGIGSYDRDIFNGTAEELDTFWKTNSI